MGNEAGGMYIAGLAWRIAKGGNFSVLEQRSVFRTLVTKAETPKDRHLIGIKMFYHSLYNGFLK